VLNASLNGPLAFFWWPVWLFFFTTVLMGLHWAGQGKVGRVRPVYFVSMYAPPPWIFHAALVAECVFLVIAAKVVGPVNVLTVAAGFSMVPTLIGAICTTTDDIVKPIWFPRWVKPQKVPVEQEAPMPAYLRQDAIQTARYREIEGVRVQQVDKAHVLQLERPQKTEQAFSIRRWLKIGKR